jgi:hypothetical protein
MTPRQQRAIGVGSGAIDFERRPGEPIIELHWRFAARRHPSPLSVDEVLSRAEVLRVGTIDVRAPSREDALILQALHGTKHGWSQAEEVATFARLMERWPEAAAGFRQRAISRAVVLAFALVDRLASDRPPPSPPAPLAAMVDACITRMCSGDGGWRPDHAWALAWADTPLDRLRYRLHALLAPTLEEWKWVRLSDALAWLYPAVRLVRLAIRR